MARPAPFPAFLMLLAASAFALSGCTEGGTGATGTSATGTATTAAPDACPGATASPALPGWTVHGGRWGMAQAEGSQAICGQADRPLSSLVRGEGSHRDLEANVSFQMLAGDSGAGLVIHYQDEGDFNIVRYSPREQGWHLFTMVAGNRQKQDEASVTPPTTNPEHQEWVDLRVRSVGGHVEAWHGAVKVIDYTLRPEASHEGLSGLFLRDEGMAAHFRGFSVRPL